MADKKFHTFQEFWPFYVSEHRHPLNRRLHFVGTLLALASLAGFAVTRKKRFLGLAPVLGYGFAWMGHFVVEKNRPATFKHPGKSLRGDARMFALMLQGKMDQELEQAAQVRQDG